MIGTLAANINDFSADNPAQKPQVFHHCDRAQGLLVSIRPDEECQIARIVNRFCDRQIVLPQDLDLSEYIGQRIVMIRIDDKYLARRVQE